MEAGHSKK